MPDEDRRVLEQLETQFDDKSHSVLDQSWVGPAGWVALIVGLIGVFALLTTSVWLSYGALLLAGIGLIMVHHTISDRWSAASLRTMVRPAPTEPKGDVDGNGP